MDQALRLMTLAVFALGLIVVGIFAVCYAAGIGFLSYLAFRRRQEQRWMKP